MFHLVCHSDAGRAGADDDRTYASHLCYQYVVRSKREIFVALAQC